MKQAHEILSHCFLRGPSKKGLRTWIPIDDFIVHVAHQNRVTHQVEQTCLFPNPALGGRLDYLVIGFVQRTANRGNQAGQTFHMKLIRLGMNQPFRPT